MEGLGARSRREEERDLFIIELVPVYMWMTGARRGGIALFLGHLDECQTRDDLSVGASSWERQERQLNDWEKGRCRRVHLKRCRPRASARALTSCAQRPRQGQRPLPDRDAQRQLTSVHNTS